MGLAKTRTIRLAARRAARPLGVAEVAPEAGRRDFLERPAFMVVAPRRARAVAEVEGVAAVRTRAVKKERNPTGSILRFDTKEAWRFGR